MQNGSKAIIFSRKETGFVLLFSLLLFSLLAYPWFFFFFLVFSFFHLFNSLTPSLLGFQSRSQ